MLIQCSVIKTTIAKLLCRATAGRHMREPSPISKQRGPAHRHFAVLGDMYLRPLPIVLVLTGELLAGELVKHLGHTCKKEAWVN